jgi:hypothetical protein
MKLLIPPPLTLQINRSEFEGLYLFLFRYVVEYRETPAQDWPVIVWRMMEFINRTQKMYFSKADVWKKRPADKRYSFLMSSADARMLWEQLQKAALQPQSQLFLDQLDEALQNADLLPKRPRALPAPTQPIIN